MGTRPGRRRRELVAALALVVALALGAGTARADCCAFQFPAAMVLSPDGRFAYVVEPSGLAIMGRDPSSGMLTEVAGSGPRGAVAAMSADGAVLLVADYSRITPARRDPDTGLLSPGAAVRTPGDQSVGSMAPSPDGHELYVTTSGGSVLIYAISPGTGALVYAGTSAEAGANPPRHLGDLTLARDGRFLYADGFNGTYVYARDTATGALTPAGSQTTGRATGNLLLSPDDSRLYVGTNPYAVLARDATTGALGAPVTDDRTADSVAGPTVIAPDGRDLYTLAPSAVSQLRTGAEGLTSGRTYRNYVDRTRGLRGARVLAVAPDGRNVYVATGGVDGRTGHIVVFARDTTTGELAYAGVFDPTTSPPTQAIALHLSFTIDHGAQFTNDRRVTLTFPDPYADVEISNDGGFRSATPVAWRGGGPLTVPWTLASSGPERLPKTVYARTTGPFPDVTRDDIVLDERSPVVLSASVSAAPSGRAARVAARSTLRVSARDRVSGVGAIQLGGRRGRPGPWRRYRPHGRYAAPSVRGLRVRVRDRAGNRSAWHHVTVVRRRTARR